MSKSNLKSFQTIEWTVGACVSLIMIVAWTIGRDALASSLSIYDIFPLFGLLAFGLMWSHYILGSIRRLLGLDEKKRSIYWSVSTGLVLFLLIAHPLLLNTALINDGLGLPPASYEAAYGSKAIILLLGSAALVVFLAFELHRWYREKSWWKYVDGAQVFAMAAIFLHALVLGRELTMLWFAIIWWGLGVSLVASIVYNRLYDKENGEKS